jgi:hypothetical protein
MNQVAMLTGYVNPGEVSIADPNLDVVYGLGYLSLEKEPVVVQVPDFGDRFWTVPVYDARTDQISELGQQYGTKPGFYMVVGPNWKGDTPSGIAGVVRSSTDFAVTMPRIFMNDTPEDHAAIQPALNQIQFSPYHGPHPLQTSGGLCSRASPAGTGFRKDEGQLELELPRILTGVRPYRVVVNVGPELYRLFAQLEGLAKTAADRHRPFVPAV